MPVPLYQHASDVDETPVKFTTQIMKNENENQVFLGDNFVCLPKERNFENMNDTSSKIRRSYLPPFVTHNVMNHARTQNYAELWNYSKVRRKYSVDEGTVPRDIKTSIFPV